MRHIKWYHILMVLVPFLAFLWVGNKNQGQKSGTEDMRNIGDGTRVELNYDFVDLEE